jgi:hypothetical protein
MSQLIRRAVSVAGTLLLAAAAGACDPGEEDAAGAVDQPSPTDWESQNAELRMAPPKSPRTIAAMMFDIGGGPPNAANIMNVIGGTGQSQRHMFQEISYGIQDTQPEYFGPYRLPQNNCLTIACCGPSSDQTGNGATVQMHMDALGKTFNHYFWVYGNIPSGANCGTWGDEGSPSRIAVYSSYSFHQIVGYAQEIGHNFGMTHEPTMCCGGTVSGNNCTGGTTFADNTAGCQHMEYSNSLSFMGNGARHPSAVHKYHQGWMAGCNLVKVGASTTITMVPQELPCDGVQLVQIPAPKTRPGPGIRGDAQGTPPMLTHYYLEMRAPLGFDSGLGPMILVSIGPQLPAANRNAPYVYLLDTNPGTTTDNDAGLRAGGTYSDPGGGLTITVNSIDNASASVTITTTGTGSLQCGDNTAFTAPGPDATSCGPLFGGGVGGAGGTTGAGGRGGSGGSTGGAGGRGGSSAGTAGTTGAAGAGGRGGAAGGTAGRGGSTGGGAAGSGAGGAAAGGRGGDTTAGAAGSSASGSGGSAVTGTGGSGATGGASASGTGGTGASGAAGNTVVTGTAGNGATGTGGAGTTPGEAAGGCSCDTVPGGPSSATTVLGLLLGMVTIARRRSRRARMP